jgi:hypothetical protein
MEETPVCASAHSPAGARKAAEMRRFEQIWRVEMLFPRM